MDKEGSIVLQSFAKKELTDGTCEQRLSQTFWDLPSYKQNDICHISNSKTHFNGRKQLFVLISITVWRIYRSILFNPKTIINVRKTFFCCYFPTAYIDFSDKKKTNMHLYVFCSSTLLVLKHTLEFAKIGVGWQYSPLMIKRTPNSCIRGSFSVIWMSSTSFSLANASGRL